MKMSAMDKIAMVLLIIGGLNWGLVGVFKYDLVAGIFGGGDATKIVPRIIYIIVGLSAIWLLISWLSKSGSSTSNPTT